MAVKQNAKGVGIPIPRGCAIRGSSQVSGNDTQASAGDAQPGGAASEAAITAHAHLWAAASPGGHRAGRKMRDPQQRVV